MLKSLRRTAAIAAASLAALVVTAAPASASLGGNYSLNPALTKVPGYTLMFSDAILYGSGGNFQVQVCTQVRQADGSFINKSGTCVTWPSHSAGADFIAPNNSYVSGHTYRTWSWAYNYGNGGSTTVTSYPVTLY